MYVQVEVHNETASSGTTQPCQSTGYVFQNSLSLLRVTPDGDVEWRKFVDFHADNNGPLVVQPRAFAGETIPDGLGGVLAAWTYFFPGSRAGEKPRFEARLSRIGPSGQSDFTLPMTRWNSDPMALFDRNMVLGDDNTLYATNGYQLVGFHIPSGEVKWAKQAPEGIIQIHWATAGGGLIVTKQGRAIRLDRDGNDFGGRETVAPLRTGDIGLAQFDLFDHAPSAPLQLREFQFHLPSVLLGVEDGAPLGQGRIVDFVIR